MKSFADLVAGMSASTLLGILAIIIVAVVVYHLVSKSIAKSKDKKLQDNAPAFGPIHLDSFFKVKKINEEKGIIYCSFNPSRNYPSGTGGAWFKMNGIPSILCVDGQVIKVTKGEGGKITYVGFPPF